MTLTPEQVRQWLDAELRGEMKPFYSTTIIALADGWLELLPLSVRIAQKHQDKVAELAAENERIKSLEAMLKTVPHHARYDIKPD